MDETEKKIYKAIKNVKTMDSALYRAKTHTKYDMMRINSTKRCKKWKELYTKTITEYHAWIETELAKQKTGVKQ